LPFSNLSTVVLVMVLLPCLLAAWAIGATPNIALPVYGNWSISLAFIAGGVVLLIARAVRGLRFWIPHPVYTALVAICLGVSMISKSAAGLWLVTPSLTAALAALVFAYKRSDVLILPPDNDRRPTTWEGVRFVVIVVLPWLALYEFTTHMGIIGTAFKFPFEDHLSVYPWTAIVYETSYLTVTFAPTWTRTNRQLRQLMITSWVAMAVVYPFYWFLPSAAPRRPMIDDSWIAHLLYSERILPPTAAFPSFHVLWAVFVGRLWPRWLWITYALTIAISCITTGMHYIPDVLAALAISPFLLEPGRRIWKPLVRFINSQTRVWRVAAVFIPAALLMASIHFDDPWILCGALCLAAPWILAIVRWQLPSMLAKAFLGLVLLRLWMSGCPLSLICGVCAIGIGLMRFVEETDRRWYPPLLVVVGALLTTLASPAAPALRP